MILPRGYYFKIQKFSYKALFLSSLIIENDDLYGSTKFFRMVSTYHLGESLFITKLSKFMLVRKLCSVLLIITKLLHLCVAFETWAAMLCEWSRIQAVD